jgi:hypothetical protein
MAEEKKQQAPAATPATATPAQDDKEFGKKCAATGVNIRRTRRFYRNGKYYKNQSTYVKMIRTQKAEAKGKDAAGAGDDKAASG